MKKKKEWLSQETKLLAAEVVLFAPATIFWLCALIYVGMETDYLFDMVIIPASKYWIGLLLIQIAITALPGLGGAVAYLIWKRYNNRMGMFLMIIGGVMVVAGIACSVIKF